MTAKCLFCKEKNEITDKLVWSQIFWNIYSESIPKSNWCWLERYSARYHISTFYYVVNVLKFKVKLVTKLLVVNV